MTQNINLSNYLNSLTGNTAKTQVEGQGQMTNSSVPASDVKTAVEIIKNMLPGDIFTGSFPVMRFLSAWVTVSFLMQAF